MNCFAVFRQLFLAGVTGVAVLALAAACGGDGGHGTESGAGHGSGATATTAPPANGATFNDTDVAFAQNMIPHHRQAVEMADLANRASDPEIKQLAAQIKAAQDPEIKTLTGWLTAWGKPVEPPQGHGGHEMPGMMSDADLGKLKAAKGEEFDRRFAQMMIDHHKGAIEMAREEQADGANAEAKALAATIERTQADEVTKLQAIVDRL
jgi:uncharacterized protein (DUF305 family)